MMNRLRCLAANMLVVVCLIFWPDLADRTFASEDLYAENLQNNPPKTENQSGDYQESIDPVYARTQRLVRSWSLHKAWNLLQRFHYKSGELPNKPVNKVQFSKFIKIFDPHAVVESIEAKNDSSLGIYLLDNLSTRVAVPIRNGPAWKQGLRYPLLLEQGLDIAGGELVGRNLVAANSKSISHTITPEKFVGKSAEIIRHKKLTILRIFRLDQDMPLSKIVRLVRNEQEKRDSRWILDLRYCGGGDVFVGADLASLWFDHTVSWGGIVDSKSLNVELSTGPSDYPDVLPPKLILTSHFTASACEHLAAGLQQLGQAVVVGKRTYGKCLVQSSFPLNSNYNIRFSTGKWQLPEKTTCQTEGLLPNVKYEGNVHDDLRLFYFIADL